MLYRDYLKNKYQSTAVKLANAEGVPCVLEYSKGKNMRNYEAYGNSMNGKNLLQYPYNYTTKTINGITFTDNGDGSITANGTATANAYFVMVGMSWEEEIPFSAGTYTLSGCPAGGGLNTYALSLGGRTSANDNRNVYAQDIGNGKTITINSGRYDFIIAIYSGTTVENLIFKPQLEIGSTATEWQSPAISPENPVEIQSVGNLTTKNLLPYPYIYTTKTINGVTFTDNGDGSITIDGTATANAVFYLVGKQDNYTLDKCGLKIGDNYTISKTLISGDSIANVYFTANYYNENGKMQEGAVISNRNTATKTIESDFKVWGIYLLVAKDKTVNNTTIKLQLEKGSSATEYEPYHKYDIPITVTGKNLFNKEACHCNEIKAEPPTVIDINTYGVGVLWSDQLISLFKPNTTYTISCEFECVDVPSDDYTFNNGILGFLIQPKISGYSSINMLVTHQLVKGEIYHFSKTFTVPSNFSEGTYIMYVYRNSYKNSDGKPITASAICRNIQIEEGTSSTAYEPYKGSQTTHIYLDEPLRKVGDYTDYIDFKNQKVVRKVKEKQLVGAEQWSRYSSFRGFYSGISDMLIQNSGYGFCSHYPRTTKPENMGVRFGANNIVAYFTQLYTDENPLTIYEWKAKLAEWNVSGNPMKITYILAESTEETISLPALKTFKGTSIMSVDTAVLPSNIKAKYIRT